MITARDARKVFGPKQTFDYVLRGTEGFYTSTFGEELGRSYQEDGPAYFERLLHELGHCYSLKEEFSDSKEMTERIVSLGPMARDGNEIDALAYSILISQWLQYPLTFQIIKDTVSLGNIRLVTSTPVLRRLVRYAMTAHEALETSVSIARAIYEEAYLKSKEDDEDENRIQRTG